MPVIQLFNTASGQIEPLHVADSSVSLYVCGVTPYDTTHVGHAFTYVIFDTLARFLRGLGTPVTYVQNVTDIDDDIIRKSRELGLSYDELGSRETERYVQDMASLNVASPDHFVRATEVIPQIVAAVSTLLSAGFAYESGGNIYFDSTRVRDYGSLAHAGRDQLIALAARHGGFPDDIRKRDKLDFLLWQAEAPDEPSWPGPLGPGRPGWHIECSTIASTILGVPIDIHGGGQDLVFPHHASEIAEAESLTGTRPFVRCWMHVAMVRMDGEKMSKSLGNMAFVRDLLQTYSSDALRLYLLSHHYRQPWEYRETDIGEFVDMAGQLSGMVGDDLTAQSVGSPDAIMLRALQNDLDTPAVVARMGELLARPLPLTGEERSALIWSAATLGLTAKRIVQQVAS